VPTGLVAVVRDLPVWVRWLVLGQFASSLGSLAWLFLTLYLVSARGLGTAAAGAAVGVYGVGVILGNLAGGSAGDRFGLRPTALVALTTSAACCLVLPWLPTVALVLVAGTGGFAGGCARPLMSALVAGGLPTSRRREAIALSRSAMNAGAVLGPPLGALLSGRDFGLVFVLDGATTLLLVVIVALRVPAGRDARAGEGPSPSMWSAFVRDHALRRLLLGIVAVDTVYRLMYTVLPLQLRDSSVPIVGYALLLALNSVVIVLVEAPLALRLREHRAVAVISTGCVAVGVGFLVLAVAPGLAGATVMMLVVTGGEMLYKPTATAYAADLAPKGMLGRYQSAYSAASISGTLLSPVLGGALYQLAPALVWPAACALALVAGWWIRGSSVTDTAVEPAA
jgi:MFS family permease